MREWLFNATKRHVIAPLTTDTSNATSPSLLGEENVHAMSKSIIKPDKETTLLQASTRWQKIQKKKSTQVQRIKKQYEDQIKYQKMVHEVRIWMIDIHIEATMH